MKDIERRIALLDIKDELAKTLKPCPFCGGSLADFPGVMIFEKRVSNTDLYHVHCIHCGAMGAGAQSVEWAVANWNGRAENAKLQ